MKNTFYFSHDYNTRSDSKIKNLIRKQGMLGYGVFWSIIEDLYNNANALQLDYDSIAYDLRIDKEVVMSVINDFDLFIIENNSFGSLSVQRRLDKRTEKSQKARMSAYKRWGKDANAMQTQCAPNAIKERKGKETKVKESKVNKSILKEKEKFFSSDIYDCYNEILNYFPEHLHPKNPDSWLKTIKDLNQIDKIPFVKIQEIVKKTRADNFWSKNFLTLTKLRKKNKDGIKYVVYFNEQIKAKFNPAEELMRQLIR